MIDTALHAQVDVIENGVAKRKTVLKAIYQRLWSKEMKGNRRALKTRLQFEEFETRHNKHHTREVIIEGGLPDLSETPAMGDADEEL